MNKDKMDYVEYIKYHYFNEPFLSKICTIELKNPKFKDLLFGFINGNKKKMQVLDKETNTRLEF